MRMRVVAVVAAVAAVLSACGGSGGASRPKLVAQLSTTTTAPAGPSTTVAGGAAAPSAGSSGQASPQAPSTTAVPGGGGAGGQSPVTPPQGPGPEKPVTATLDKPCVHRGSPADQQGFTAHLGARSAVGYDTIYSDNSNELTNRSYTTGFGYGKSDDNGTYHTSWVVPATAPPGTAKLYVLYSGEKPPIELPFTIVTETGKCP